MFYGMSFAELGWGRALLVALSGLVITFMMLAILALVIIVLSKIVASMDGKKKPAAPAAKPAVEKPATETKKAEPAVEKKESVNEQK